MMSSWENDLDVFKVFFKTYTPWLKQHQILKVESSIEFCGLGFAARCGEEQKGCP